MGYPTSNELGNPDGVGRRSVFQHGYIYWTPTTGAWEIGGAIFAHWGQLGYERGSLGYPISDELGNPDGVGRRNVFQHGYIYYTPTTGPWEIGGAIFAHWGQLGYERGSLGYPISDELGNPDGVGRRNVFQHGYIYYTPTTGPWEIGGAIFAHWGQLGYERGSLGYPVTDETSNPGQFSPTSYRRNFFQKGAIYFDGGTHVGLFRAWTPASPAVAVAPAPANAGPESATSNGSAALTPGVNGCPAGTSNYASPKDPFNCVAVEVDTSGYPAGVRKGFSNHSGSPAPDEGVLPSRGFGLAHALDDHNVPHQAVAALIYGAIPYASRTADPALKRVVYSDVFVIDNQPVETISAVVQKRSDTEGLAPDGYDFGLVTGYCNNGIPNPNNYQGFCPNQLPIPYGPLGLF